MTEPTAAQIQKAVAEAIAKAKKAAKAKRARKAEANRPQFPGSHRGY
jgi:hypothetical protein